MKDLVKYEKNIEIVYFINNKDININNSLGKIVHLKVKSPLHYGIREIGYYGKIVKITNDYFDILEFCGDNFNFWYLKEIEKKENKEEKYKKRWAKKSIIKLESVDMITKLEKVELYKSN